MFSKSNNFFPDFTNMLFQKPTLNLMFENFANMSMNLNNIPTVMPSINTVAVQKSFAFQQQEDLFQFPSDTSSSINPMLASFFETIDFGNNQKNIFQKETSQHQLVSFTKPQAQQIQQPYKLKAKTELCKNFQINGECKFSDKCCFAHGKEELKAKINLPENYKTKPCKQYFTQGYCPYAKRE